MDATHEDQETPTCSECDASLAARAQPAKTCSPRCRTARSRRLQGFNDRTCATCASAYVYYRFKADGTYPRACGEECERARFNAEQREARRVNPRVRGKVEPWVARCARRKCDRQFKTATRKKLYCDKECQTAHHYEEYPERHAERMAARLADPTQAEIVMAVRLDARHLRRARLCGNQDSMGVSRRDWTRLVRRYRGHCAYCGDRPETLHMDHVIPLARGGRHAIGNVLPACSACNGRKRAKLLAAWRSEDTRRGRKALSAA